MVYVFIAIFIITLREFIAFIAWVRQCRDDAATSLVCVDDATLRAIQFREQTSILVPCSDVFAVFQTVRLRSNRREIPAIIIAKTDISISIDLV